MSQLTDYAENRLVDMIRAQAWTLPANLYAGLTSTATDSSTTELSGTNYGRISMPRAAGAWAPTQGGSGGGVSTGNSHASSNVSVLDFGTAGSAWGTATAITLYDQISDGNPICSFPITGGLQIDSGAAVSFPAGAVTFTLGVSGGCSDYLSNQLIDFVFRGFAFNFPGAMYEALFTAAPSNAGGGSEVGGGAGYARVVINGSPGTWAGTQGVGTTAAASTGTTGQTSNNAAITFPAPTGAWGSIGWCGEYDAPSGGNLLFWAPLAATKSVPAGATPPAFQSGARTITFA